jgi:hypothetical protein
MLLLLLKPLRLLLLRLLRLLLRKPLRLLPPRLPRLLHRPLLLLRPTKGQQAGMSGFQVGQQSSPAREISCPGFLFARRLP